MHRIVESSQRLRFLVVIAAAATVFFGIRGLGHAPVDVLPEFAAPVVEVQTEALGLSAAEVESLITLNIEELLAGTPWLQSISSRSVPGLSSVLLVFEPATNLMNARQLVQERLTLAYMLPNVSKPPVMLQPVSTTNRVMVIGISSKVVSPLQMSVLARWTIKPRLMGVPGVANVSIWGQRERQLQVLIDQERLGARDVTQEQIIKTTGNALWVSHLSFLNASFPGTGGWIDTPNQRLGVEHRLPISTPADLARVPVDGAKLHLGDVAEVVEGHPLLIGDALVNGAPGLLLVIEKLPGVDGMALTRKVESALEGMRPGLPGIDVDTAIFRPATFIRAGLGNLGAALLAGAFLMALAIGAFLWSWRRALISCLAVPVSLAVALAILHLQGSPFNWMVVAGLLLALGAVVGDAVVDVENAVTRLRQKEQAGSKTSAARALLEGALEVRGAILYATLVEALVVVPLFFLGGESGGFFRPLAVSYAVALLASVVVALTLTPALGAILLRSAPPEQRESPLGSRLRRWYEARLSAALAAPAPVFLVLGLVGLAGALGLWALAGRERLPAFEDRNLLVEIKGAPGMSHPEMLRMAGQMSRELMSLPGVDHVGGHMGRAITGDQVVSMNSGELWVAVDSEADYAGMVGAVTEVVKGYPGIDATLETYLGERLQRALTGTSDDVVVRIFGPESATLRRVADQVALVMRKVEGVGDVQVEGQVEEPQVEVKVDLAAADRHGLKPGDIRRQMATVFAGLGVGVLSESQKVYDVVVWGTEKTRHSLTNVKEFLLETPEHHGVRLKDVAEVRVAATPVLVQHDAISRSIDVAANVQGGAHGSIAAEVKRRVQDLKFPLEYHAVLKGEYAERMAAQRRALDVAIAALIGVFLLLQAAFRSWRLAWLAFLLLPFALAGGVLAALAGAGSLSVGSTVAFLAVLGFSARGAIILIKHCQQVERESGQAFGSGLVLRAALERFSPILTTAVALAAAFLPLALFGSVAGLELAQPMAVVVLGGLVTSTFVTLFAVPALVLRLGPSPAAEAADLDRPEPSPTA